MEKAALNIAIEKLAKEFEALPWEYNIVSKNGVDEVIRLWPGDADEDIMVAVLKSFAFQENLHRQDYYFLNYAYLHSYTAVSDRPENVVTLNEGECYVGQPFCGYGVRHTDDNPAIVIGVLIQKKLFYRDFLPIVSADPAMLRFFIDPQNDVFSTDFLRFSFPEDSPFRSLLEMMVMEYADRREGTQIILKSLTGALIMHIARRYHAVNPAQSGQTLSEKIISYMGEHLAGATLSDIARHFSYHPTYVSNLLKKETGRTFSEIQLRLRMERAVMLINGTSLSIEEIAAILGYNSSNFYKAFRSVYGVSPRAYLRG